LRPIFLQRLFDDPDRPLAVDMGCGKGRFLLARAAADAETNFLGIDRMLRRIRKVDRKAVRQDLSNIRLLRMEAYYATMYLIPESAVSVYYIFFPDPWPKKRHHSHRLFNEKYMNALYRTLAPGGRLHFATDHMPYFEEVRELFNVDARFREIDPYIPPEEERTDFELWYIQRGEIGRCSVERAG